MNPLPYIILLFLIALGLSAEPKPSIIEVEINRGPEWKSYKAWYWVSWDTNGVTRTGLIKTSRVDGVSEHWEK